jgi:hypothetical protein
MTTAKLTVVLVIGIGIGIGIGMGWVLVYVRDAGRAVVKADVGGGVGAGVTGSGAEWIGKVGR